MFAVQCAGCHGPEALGTAQGPALAMNQRVAEQSADQLAAYIQRGNPAAGMPSFADLPDGDRTALARYLLRLNVDTILKPPVDGRASPGRVGRATAGRLAHLQRLRLGQSVQSAQTDHAEPMLSRLKLKWVFPLQYFGLETTPLAADGVMYVTGPGQVFALDAETGGLLWHYSRPATAGPDRRRTAGHQPRRRAASRQDLLRHRQRPLDRAGSRERQAAVGDADGASEHEGPAPWRHRRAAHRPRHRRRGRGRRGSRDPRIRRGVRTRHRRGRVADVDHPSPRRARQRDLAGPEPVTGGGGTWLTGSYDASSDTLYWATGNPYPNSDDSDRGGDNLYTNCVLALNARTGALKWHYQFTPHDVRTGMRTSRTCWSTRSTGARRPSSCSTPIATASSTCSIERTARCCWRSRFCAASTGRRASDPNGRPVIKDPRGCPGDAANWSSTAYSPETRLYYFLALEECVGDKPGGYPDRSGQRFLRAVNIETGDIVWEVPQPGAARAKTWSGVLATPAGCSSTAGPTAASAPWTSATARRFGSSRPTCA